jgi:hypothetical protein
MALLETRGTVTFLLVRNVGSGFGPPSDFIDAEVIVKLNAEPDRAMGFQLRKDGQQPARQGMLDLLRDAYNHSWTVVLNYDLEPGRKNGIATLVALTR